MGWLYGWGTRKELVDHLINGNGVKTIKHTSCGTNLWAVHEGVKPGTGETVRWACLYLINGPAFGKGNGDPYAWGYKDVDESMGPFRINFPASWLDLLTPTTHKHALDWRAAVKARGEKIAKMRLGTFWQMSDERVFKIEKRLSPQSFIVVSADGILWRTTLEVLLKCEQVEGFTCTSGTSTTDVGSAQDASASPSATTTAPAA